MSKMDAMPKRKPFDLEMAEAIITVLGLIVVAFLMLFGGVALIEWLLGAP